MKKRILSGSRGMAMVFVAGAVLLLPAILFAVHNYVSAKTRDMAWISARKTLEYQLLASLQMTAEKLKSGRWYGQNSASGTLEFNEANVKVTVYCDDYVQKARRSFSTPEPGQYLMLDHIKVFAEAKLDHFVYFAYGKFIISPEAVYQGDSTIGIDYHVDNLAVPTQTLRRLVNIRMGNPQEYANHIAGFRSLAEKSSRELLGQYFESEGQAIARNYYYVTRMQDALGRVFNNRFQSFSKPMLRMLVKSVELNSDLENQNILQNYFILEAFRRFVPELDFNASESSRLAAAKNISIRTVMPEKVNSPEVKKILRSVFGGEHPVAADTRTSSRSWYFTPTMGATERFLADLSISGRYMDTPTEFINSRFRFVGGHAYRFVWEARCSNQIERGGVDFFERYLKDWQGGKFLFRHPECVDTPDLQVGKKVGPEIAYGDYFLRGSEKGAEFSVTAVLHFFRKMVDSQNTVFGPDKNTAFVSDVNTARAGGAVRLIY